MVKKIDNSKNKRTIKLKQKQNVNVKVLIDQRDLKKKSNNKKRYNRPTAKREGVSTFSTGFTPVYIQSGNPYTSPIPPVPPTAQSIISSPALDVTPIKVPVQQKKVSSFTNPPVTSTTNINEEAKKAIRFTTPKQPPKLTIHSIDNRSISPLTVDDDLGSVYSFNKSAITKTPMENTIGGLMYTNTYDDASEIFSRDVKPIKIRKPRRTKKEMEEAREGMGMWDERAIQKDKEKEERKQKRELKKIEKTIV